MNLLEKNCGEGPRYCDQYKEDLILACTSGTVRIVKELNINLYSRQKELTNIQYSRGGGGYGFRSKRMKDESMAFRHFPILYLAIRLDAA